MISHTAKTDSAQTAVSANDIKQESKQKKSTLKSTGSQTKLFLQTAPVSSLFQLRRKSCNYSSLQRLEQKKRLSKDVIAFSKAVIAALKCPQYWEAPFVLIRVPMFDDRFYLSDGKNVVQELYMSEHSVRVAARLINSNAGKRLIVAIWNYNKNDVSLL